jgi:hypothetical protein
MNWWKVIGVGFLLCLAVVPPIVNLGAMIIGIGIIGVIVDTIKNLWRWGKGE